MNTCIQCGSNKPKEFLGEEDGIGWMRCHECGNDYALIVLTDTTEA